MPRNIAVHEDMRYYYNELKAMSATHQADEDKHLTSHFLFISFVSARLNVSSLTDPSRYESFLTSSLLHEVMASRPHYFPNICHMGRRKNAVRRQ
jgi:hypothetical protein